MRVHRDAITARRDHFAMSSALRSFLSDEHGRLVIVQRPNLLITLWALFAALAFALRGSRWHDVVAFIASGFLFAWTWLELTDGDSPFRRILGAAVLVGMVALRIPS
ncbi:hypothetical protein [Lysobacter sp. HA18]